MLLVPLFAAGLWGLGAAMKTPHSARWTMIGLLLVVVMVLHVLLPDGHPVRQATGGSAAPWLLILAAVGLVLGYRHLLGLLRSRVAPENAAPVAEKSPHMGDVELERYARHIVLREIGGPGQARLHKAKVLVVGAGGLGAPSLLYLAGAGVGTLGVIDDDTVENANLQRQVIHTDARIGMPKVFSAQTAIKALNPFIEVKPYNRRLTADLADKLVAEYDLVLDGTDNFETRYLANAAAIRAGVPLVSGALSQWEGQVSVFHPAAGAPCYRCIFPEAPAPELAPSCAEAGVLGPLPGVVGSMMAAEAVKVITGAGTPLRGEMLIYDALHGETRKITLRRNPDCPACGKV